MSDSPKTIWSRTDVLNYVNENTIDFVARGSSSWHLMGIRAFLKSLSEKKKKVLRGLLVISAHQDDNYLIKKSEIRFQNYVSVKIVYMSSDGEDDKKKLLRGALHKRYKMASNKSELYVLSPNDGWYLLAANIDVNKYNPISVIIDEGFSQYNENRQWLLGAYHSYKSLSYVFKVALQTRINELLKKKCINQEITYTLFDKKNNMKVNDDVISNYQKILAEDNAGACNEDHIEYLFLTQPFVEDGHISMQSMELFFEKYFEMDSRRTTSFKIHPRDKTSYSVIEKSRGHVIDTQLNAEAYCENLRNKPKCVIGFNSTSLITLSLFYDIKAVSLNNLIRERLIGECWKESFDNFEKYFKEIVMFPKNSIELEEILEGKV